MNAKTNKSKLHLILIAFVLSAAMLAYEILLTRIASLLLTSQYIFLIIGVSLLGISAGAILEYYFASRQQQTTETTPGIWLSWTAGVLVLAIIFILRIGAESGMLALALSAALPFVVSGLIFARLFRLFTEMTGSLYAADLVGAAAGALMVPLLLPALGPVQSILVLASVLAGTGAVAVFAYHRGVKSLAAFTILVAILGLLYLNDDNAFLGQIPIGKDLDKDLYRLTSLRGDSAEIVESRWSTFGRTDLVRFGSDPSVMSIFIDGAAGTSMLRFDGSFDDSSAGFVHAVNRFGGLVPLLNLGDHQKDNALIIGPGGGRDVLLTLKTGFKKITAVEINPQMVEIVKDHRNFNGGIYTDYENVEIVVEEGRKFLRHSDETYDLIMLFMPITKSSRSLNAFALSESYLFTKEAFNDYHRHLTDEGSLLIMAHGMPEVLKLVTTALNAMQEEGLTLEVAMNHLYVLGSEMMPLFGMRKLDLEPAESEYLHAAAHYSMFDCQYSYIPGVEQQLLRPPLTTSIDAGVPMMNPLLIDLAAGKLPIELIERDLGLNLVPATDNRPFFFQYGFTLPEVILTVLWLALAVLATVVFVPAYKFRIYQQPRNGEPFWWLLLFFVAIGVGYIVIELALFQQLVFYLGDPSRSLALLLAGLLVGSGIGSFISRKSRGRVAVLGGLFSAGIALLILVVVPVIFSSLHNSSPVVQQTIAVCIMLIQGVPMGIMFPIGLRLAENSLGKISVPWMWAVNGSASVAGSALAVAIAMSGGYIWTLIFGAACYLYAALSMWFTNKQLQLKRN